MIIMLLLAGFIIIFLLLYQKRRSEYKKNMAQLSAVFQKEIVNAQLEIQEQTLQKISQEIHDNIGQILSLAKLHLREEPDMEKLSEKVRESRSLISKAIMDLRDLSKSMNSDRTMELGLYAAIQEELEMLLKTGAYKVNFEPHGDYRRIDPHQELIIFRMVQEILNNTIKHANASEISLGLFYGDECIDLIIADNGQGFDSKANNARENKKGQGLKNLDRRAQLIGATFSIQSKCGEGCTARLHIPSRLSFQHEQFSVA